MTTFKTVQDINALKYKTKRNSSTILASSAPKKQSKKNTAIQVQKSLSDSKLLEDDLAKKNAILQDLRKTSTTISEKLLQNSENLRKSATVYTSEIAEGFDKSIRSSIFSLFIISLIAFAFAGWIAIYISKKITDPLMKGIEFTKIMANGDLTADLDINQEDEIGILASNLQVMNNRIREIIVWN
jgi:methyl-accepting chemotaxis protein